MKATFFLLYLHILVMHLIHWIQYLKCNVLAKWLFWKILDAGFGWLSSLFDISQFKKNFWLCIYFYVYGYFACMHGYASCGYSACRCQMRASDPLQVKLQMTLCCHVSTRNQTRGLCKNKECSLPLSHLFSPSHFQMKIRYLYVSYVFIILHISWF